jgi:acetyl-CoA acetyltransferase
MQMGLRGDAAIVGYAEYRPEKFASAPQAAHLEQIADLTRQALADAGLEASEVDGIVLPGSFFHEATMLIPAMVTEYLGLNVNFAEVVDLGGTTPVAMAWRAAAAIELGIASVVVCVIPSRMAPEAPGTDLAALAEASRFGAHSTIFGAPEAEFDLPYGHVAQNTGYAMIAQRYKAQYGYDDAALAKIVVDQRTNACANPDAIFHGQPLTVEDVLNSRMIADPLRVLEIVMPVAGGSAFVVAERETARRLNHRPAFIKGFGERLATKSPSYARDMLATPVGPASRAAFAMARLKPGDVDMAQIYDCYSITVLLTLEDAGFCAKGAGMRFVKNHDLTFRGDFPVNTHGGQLGCGQTMLSGGMSQIIEAVRQIAGRAGERQLARHDIAYVSGTGGVMSEQGALILVGEG